MYKNYTKQYKNVQLFLYIQIRLANIMVYAKNLKIQSRHFVDIFTQICYTSIYTIMILNIEIYYGFLKFKYRQKLSYYLQ